MRAPNSGAGLGWRILTSLLLIAAVILVARAQVSPQDSVCVYAKVRQYVPEVCGSYVDREDGRA